MDTLLIGVDPGPMESAYVVLAEDRKVLDHGIEDNHDLARRLKTLAPPGYELVIEMPKSYGNVMGDSILETCVWVGRFMHEWYLVGGAAHRLPRKTVVTCLCGNPRAGDKNVRRALLDLYPQTGGGKEPAAGNKAEPGPLYGIRLDEWQALGLAVAYMEITKKPLEMLLT